MLEPQSVSIDRTIGPSLQISSEMSHSLVFILRKATRKIAINVSSKYNASKYPPALFDAY